MTQLPASFADAAAADDAAAAAAESDDDAAAAESPASSKSNRRRQNLGQALRDKERLLPIAGVESQEKRAVESQSTQPQNYLANQAQN